mmetsp:Transcript_1773/g.1877  ORF Transcript_1773/g.1877 Transcript_1773/m.1877 type:complete len:536 (-) Transcript_1773:155-1762(-)
MASIPSLISDLLDSLVTKDTKDLEHAISAWNGSSYADLMNSNLVFKVRKAHMQLHQTPPDAFKPKFSCHCRVRCDFQIILPCGHAYCPTFGDRIARKQGDGTYRCTLCLSSSISSFAESRVKKATFLQISKLAKPLDSHVERDVLVDTTHGKKISTVITGFADSSSSDSEEDVAPEEKKSEKKIPKESGSAKLPVGLTSRPHKLEPLYSSAPKKKEPWKDPASTASKSPAREKISFKDAKFPQKYTVKAEVSSDEDDDEEEHKWSGSTPSRYSEPYREPKRSETAKLDCEICCNTYAMDQIRSLECDHRFCEGCLQRFIRNNLKESKVTDREMICMKLSCDKPISSFVIQSLLTRAEWDQYNHQLVNRGSNILTCPKCSEQFEVDKDRRQRVTCMKCRYKFCGNCADPPHPGVSCTLQYREKTIAEFLKMGQKLMPCPSCFELYTKDDKCEHVRCERCKIDFCFSCSCYREPTLAHDNSYHRPRCPLYAKPGDEPDKYDRKCSACRRKGTVCDRPQDLVRGMHVPEFYAKESGKA